MVYQIWLDGDLLVTIQKDDIWRAASTSKINLTDAFAIALSLEEQFKLELL